MGRDKVPIRKICEAQVAGSGIESESFAFQVIAFTTELSRPHAS